MSQPTPTDSFPRQSARTLRFTRGTPRAVTVSDDGSRVLFVRSMGGDDPVGRLWALDRSDDGGFEPERLVVDPQVLLDGADEELSAEERARRERSREAGAGVVGYDADPACSRAVLTLSGRLWVVDVADGGARELPVAGSVLDPRLDPTGRRVAYVAGAALHVVDAEGAGGLALAGPDAGEDSVSWGRAEFVAAEEMGRHRGYWWAPSGEVLLVARVDESPVRRWYVADAARPEAEPGVLAYPAAGTDNADVTLHLVGVDGAGHVPVRWDRDALPYVVAVHWSEGGDPLVTVMSRDQRRRVVLALDGRSGATSPLSESTDPAWVDVVPGVPAWLPDGRLVDTVEDDGTRRLSVDGEPVTPAGLQVAAVLSVSAGGVLVQGAHDPTETHLWLVTDGGSRALTADGGVHSGALGGGTLVRLRRDLDGPGVRTEVVRDDEVVARVASRADTPTLTAHPTILRVGEHDLAVGVVLPSDHRPGTPLPVLLDPYGGPHHREVLQSHDLWLEPQWFADQGFAVVVADGRGTGGRGAAWDRAVHHEFAEVTLEDQVSALHAAAGEVPDLDLTRVAIRGWSYGGYLAALAVLRRPDVFHAAVAGAPVTDWRLYDTFYTERYLGHPDDVPEVYDRNSLLGDAGSLRSPLLLIHGLADDNVVAAHTLRLSAALLAAGRPHDVLPLTGVTHMTPQEVVAENLLLLQVDWLWRALGGSRSD